MTIADARRAVCYAISPPAKAERASLLKHQILSSASSLRRWNPDIELVVWSFGDLGAELTGELRRRRVDVRRCGDYRSLLSRRPGGEVVRDYPVLQKYLIGQDSAARSWLATHDQVLLIDCDTWFLGDVSRLFDAYPDDAIIASPEVGSTDGPGPHSSEYLNEDALAILAAQLDAAPVAPFNSGVILVNAEGIRCWEHVSLRALDLVTRLVASAAGRGRGEGVAVDPLRMPSNNAWIAEEVALWLAVGLERVSVGRFDRTHAALGSWFFEAPEDESEWIVGHYFSINTPSFDRWSRTGQSPAATGCQHRSSLPLDPAVRGSRLVAELGGLAVYEDLFDAETVARLRDEAFALYWSAHEQIVHVGNRGEGRGAHPARRLVAGAGNAVQHSVYHSPRLREFLERLCGMPVSPTGGRGTYNYYTRTGDFMGLHLDVEECDLVILTALHDRTPNAGARGAYRLYPGHIGVRLPEITARCSASARLLRLKPGQSLIMFGGLIPHEVLSVARDETRVVSTMCFRAGG